MHKQKRMRSQVRLDKEQAKNYLANARPGDKATECFKRVPYTTTNNKKGGMIHKRNMD